MLKKIISYKYLGLIVIGLAVLSVCLPLFKQGYFSMHDDTQVMRLYEMEKCLADGQIPCRWVSDMGAGYGNPLFNFYPVFPYYLGMVFRSLGLSFITAAKILFGLTFVFSGVFMYQLLRQFFHRWASIIGTVFFLYAPYRAVDVYVRGAMTEIWGVVFFPLILLTSYRYVKEGKAYWMVLTSLSLAGLFLSHNIMTLLFTSFTVAWSLLWLVQFKKPHRLLGIAASYLLGFGLSAFFLVPAYFEQKLVKIGTMVSDYYNYRDHFATIRQLFIDRSFNYGPSRYGPVDDMSFQVGLIHWLTVLFSALLTLWLTFKKKTIKPYLYVYFIFIAWFIALFMTHARSNFIWEAIPILSFVQFPWRLLTLVMFLGSILTAYFVTQLGRYKYITGIFLLLVVVVLNRSYFKPEKYFPTLNDTQILSGDSWKTQSMATITDYMPKQVQAYPKELAFEKPVSTNENGLISEYQKRSDFWRFTYQSTVNEPIKVTVPVFDFPTWTVLVDQQPVAVSSDNELGLIELTIPPGNHTVVGWFKNTKLRLLANGISLLSLVVVILLLGINKKESILITDKK